MKKLKPTKAWILLCIIIKVTSSAAERSSHHSGTPQHEDTNRLKKWQSPTMPAAIQIPEQVMSDSQEVACVSADTNIFEIMNEAKKSCKGNDKLCTFYFFSNHKYYKIGACAIDNQLFDALLKKYDNWLLTAEKVGSNGKMKFKLSHNLKKPDNKFKNVHPIDTLQTKEKEWDSFVDGKETSDQNQDESTASNLDLYTDKSDNDKYYRNTLNPAYLSNEQELKEFNDSCENPTETQRHNQRETLINTMENKGNQENFIKLKPTYDKEHDFFEVFLPKDKSQGQPRTIHVNINSDNNQSLLLEDDNNREDKICDPIKRELENGIPTIVEYENDCQKSTDEKKLYTAGKDFEVDMTYPETYRRENNLSKDSYNTNKDNILINNIDYINKEIDQETTLQSIEVDDNSNSDLSQQLIYNKNDRIPPTDYNKGTVNDLRNKLELNDLSSNIYNLNSNKNCFLDDATDNIKCIYNYDQSAVVPNKHINRAEYCIQTEVDNIINEIIKKENPDNVNNNNDFTDLKSNIESILQNDFEQEAQADIEANDVFNTFYDEEIYNDDFGQVNEFADNEHVPKRIQEAKYIHNPLIDIHGSPNHRNINDKSDVNHPHIYKDLDFDHSHDLFLCPKDNVLKSSHIHLNEPIDRMHEKQTLYSSNPQTISDYIGTQLDIVPPVSTTERDQPRISNSSLSTFSIDPMLQNEISKIMIPHHNLDPIFYNLLPSQTEGEPLSFPVGLDLGQSPSSLYRVMPTPPIENVFLLKNGLVRSPFNAGIGWLPSHLRIEEIRLPYTAKSLPPDNISNLGLDTEILDPSDEELFDSEDYTPELTTSTTPILPVDPALSRRISSLNLGLDKTPLPINEDYMEAITAVLPEVTATAAESRILDKDLGGTCAFAQEYETPFIMNTAPMGFMSPDSIYESDMTPPPFLASESNSLDYGLINTLPCDTWSRDPYTIPIQKESFIPVSNNNNNPYVSVPELVHEPMNAEHKRTDISLLSKNPITVSIYPVKDYNEPYQQVDIGHNTESVTPCPSVLDIPPSLNLISRPNYLQSDASYPLSSFLPSLTTNIPPYATSQMPSSMYSDLPDNGFQNIPITHNSDITLEDLEMLQDISTGPSSENADALLNKCLLQNSTPLRYEPSQSQRPSTLLPPSIFSKVLPHMASQNGISQVSGNDFLGTQNKIFPVLANMPYKFPGFIGPKLNRKNSENLLPLSGFDGTLIGPSLSSPYLQISDNNQKLRPCGALPSSTLVYPYSSHKAPEVDLSILSSVREPFLTHNNQFSYPSIDKSLNIHPRSESPSNLICPYQIPQYRPQLISPVDQLTLNNIKLANHISEVPVSNEYLHGLPLDTNIARDDFTKHSTSEEYQAELSGDSFKLIEEYPQLQSTYRNPSVIPPSLHNYLSYNKPKQFTDISFSDTNIPFHSFTEQAISVDSENQLSSDSSELIETVVQPIFKDASLISPSILSSLTQFDLSSLDQKFPMQPTFKDLSLIPPSILNALFKLNIPTLEQNYQLSPNFKNSSLLPPSILNSFDQSNTSKLSSMFKETSLVGPALNNFAYFGIPTSTINNPVLYSDSTQNLLPGSQSTSYINEPVTVPESIVSQFDVSDSHYLLNSVNEGKESYISDELTPSNNANSELEIDFAAPTSISHELPPETNMPEIYILPGKLSLADKHVYPYRPSSSSAPISSMSSSNFQRPTENTKVSQFPQLFSQLPSTKGILQHFFPLETVNLETQLTPFPQSATISSPFPPSLEPTPLPLLTPFSQSASNQRPVFPVPQYDVIEPSIPPSPFTIYSNPYLSPTTQNLIQSSSSIPLYSLPLSVSNIPEVLPPTVTTPQYNNPISSPLHVQPFSKLDSLPSLSSYITPPNLFSPVKYFSKLPLTTKGSKPLNSEYLVSNSQYESAPDSISSLLDKDFTNILPYIRPTTAPSMTASFLPDKANPYFKPPIFSSIIPPSSLISNLVLNKDINHNSSHQKLLNKPNLVPMAVPSAMMSPTNLIQTQLLQGIHPYNMPTSLHPSDSYLPITESNPKLSEYPSTSDNFKIPSSYSITGLPSNANFLPNSPKTIADTRLPLSIIPAQSIPNIPVISATSSIPSSVLSPTCFGSSLLTGDYTKTQPILPVYPYSSPKVPQLTSMPEYGTPLSPTYSKQLVSDTYKVPESYLLPQRLPNIEYGIPSLLLQSKMYPLTHKGSKSIVQNNQIPIPTTSEKSTLDSPVLPVSFKQSQLLQSQSFGNIPRYTVSSMDKKIPTTAKLPPPCNAQPLSTLENPKLIVLPTGAQVPAYINSLLETYTNPLLPIPSRPLKPTQPHLSSLLNSTPKLNWNNLPEYIRFPSNDKTESIFTLPMSKSTLYQQPQLPNVSNQVNYEPVHPFLSPQIIPSLQKLTQAMPTNVSPTQLGSDMIVVSADASKMSPISSSTYLNRLLSILSSQTIPQLAEVPTISTPASTETSDDLSLKLQPTVFENYISSLPMYKKLHLGPTPINSQYSEPTTLDITPLKNNICSPMLNSLSPVSPQYVDHLRPGHITSQTTTPYSNISPNIDVPNLMTPSLQYAPLSFTKSVIPTAPFASPIPVPALATPIAYTKPVIMAPCYQLTTPIEPTTYPELISKLLTQHYNAQSKPLIFSPNYVNPKETTYYYHTHTEPKLSSSLQNTVQSQFNLSPAQVKYSASPLSLSFNTIPEYLDTSSPLTPLSAVPQSSDISEDNLTPELYYSPETSPAPLYAASLVKPLSNAVFSQRPQITPITLQYETKLSSPVSQSSTGTVSSLPITDSLPEIKPIYQQIPMLDIPKYNLPSTIISSTDVPNAEPSHLSSVSEDSEYSSSSSQAYLTSTGSNYKLQSPRPYSLLVPSTSQHPKGQTATENLQLSSVINESPLLTNTNYESLLLSPLIQYGIPQTPSLLSRPDLYISKATSNWDSNQMPITPTYNYSQSPLSIYFNNQPNIPSLVTYPQTFLPYTLLPEVISVARPTEVPSDPILEYSHSNQLPSHLDNLSTQSELIFDSKHINSQTPSLNLLSPLNLKYNTKEIPPPLFKGPAQNFPIYPGLISRFIDSYVPSVESDAEARLETLSTRSQSTPNFIESTPSQSYTVAPSHIKTEFSEGYIDSQIPNISPYRCLKSPISPIHGNPQTEINYLQTLPSSESLRLSEPELSISPLISQISSISSIPEYSRSTVQPLDNYELLTKIPQERTDIKSFYETYKNSNSYPYMASNLTPLMQCKIPSKFEEIVNTDNIIEADSLQPTQSISYLEVPNKQLKDSKNIHDSSVDDFEYTPNLPIINNFDTLYNDYFKNKASIEIIPESFEAINSIINSLQTDISSDEYSNYQNSENFNKVAHYLLDSQETDVNKFDYEPAVYEDDKITDNALVFNEVQSKIDEYHIQQNGEYIDSSTVASDVDIDKSNNTLNQKPAEYLHNVAEMSGLYPKVSQIQQIRYNLQLPLVHSHVPLHRFAYNIPSYTSKIPSSSNYPKNRPTLKPIPTVDLSQFAESSTKTPQNPEYESNLSNFYANNHLGKDPIVYNEPTRVAHYDAKPTSYYYTPISCNSASTRICSDPSVIPCKIIESSPTLGATSLDQPMDVEIPTTPIVKTPYTFLRPQNTLSPCFTTSPEMSFTPDLLQHFADISSISSSPTSQVPSKNIGIKYEGYKTYNIPKLMSGFQTPSLINRPCMIPLTMASFPTYSNTLPNISPMIDTPLECNLDFNVTPRSLTANEYNLNQDTPVCEKSININKELKSGLINYLNKNEVLKNNFYTNNAELGIPLGNLAIARNGPFNENIIQTNDPSVTLKVWKSNLKVIEAEIKLKFKDVSVNNFMPIVNNLNKYDVERIRELVKSYIDEKYGNHIEVDEPYTVDNQYTVIKDFEHNLTDDKYNILWPANYV